MAPRPTDQPTDLVQLHIPLDDPEIGCECVWAAEVGPDRYRIANVPFFAHDVGIHDVVLALEAESCLELVDVVERRSVASFNYELRTGVDEPVFFADSRGTGAATERLGRSCFTTDLHHEPAADRFEQLLTPHARWYERFDALGRLVREAGDATS